MLDILGLEISDDTLFQAAVTFVSLIISVYFASYLFGKRRESREIKTKIFSDLFDVVRKYEKIVYWIMRWNSFPFKDQEALNSLKSEIGEIEERLVIQITEMCTDYLQISTKFRVNLKLRFGVYEEWEKAYRSIAKSSESILQSLNTKKTISQQAITSLKYAGHELTLKYIESAKKGKIRF